MPRLAAAILDMDGLLSDTEPFWQEVEVRELVRLGVPMTREMCCQTIGLRVDEAMRHWQERYPWTDCTLEELCDRLTAGVGECVRRDGRALPGVGQALDLLQARGLRLAVASSSRRTLIDAVLDKLGLAERIEVIRSAETEEYGKPHPAVFLAAARALGVDPPRCVVLEDSLNGVIAAKAARMKCIAVPDAVAQGDPRFALADARLRSLEELDGALLDRLDA